LAAREDAARLVNRSCFPYAPTLYVELGSLEEQRMKQFSVEALLAIAFGLTALLTGGGGTRTETVSAATINQLPPGKSLEIDLTRKGTVYKFDDDVDLSRVSIRSAAGARSFADLLNDPASRPRALILGTTGDIRDLLPVNTGGTTVHFDCGSVTCKCDGPADCIDMHASGRCGVESWQLGDLELPVRHQAIVR
jgi:hypothetical protein